MRLILNGLKTYAWLDTVLVALQAGSVLLGFELISTQTRDVFSQQVAGSATDAAAGHLRNLEQLT